MFPFPMFLYPRTEETLESLGLCHFKVSNKYKIKFCTLRCKRHLVCKEKTFMQCILNAYVLHIIKLSLS